jgi:hypothetical protein
METNHQGIKRNNLKILMRLNLLKMVMKLKVQGSKIILLDIIFLEKLLEKEHLEK